MKVRMGFECESRLISDGEHVFHSSIIFVSIPLHFSSSMKRREEFIVNYDYRIYIFRLPLSLSVGITITITIQKVILNPTTFNH